MKNTFALSAALLLALAAGPLGCAADSEGAGDDDAQTASDELRSGASQTKTYAGTFTAGGDQLTVELTLTAPRSAAGYQQSDSSLWKHGGAPHCRTFNSSVEGSVRLRVLGADGAVLSDETSRTFSNGARYFPSSRCPDGILASPQIEPELVARFGVRGVEVASAGGAVHLPRGYVSPGSFGIDGKATFRATGPSSFSKDSDAAYNHSEMKTDGVVSISLPDVTTIEVGVGPSLQHVLGYQETIAVELRAR